MKRYEEILLEIGNWLSKGWMYKDFVEHLSEDIFYAFLNSIIKEIKDAEPVLNIDELALEFIKRHLRNKRIQYKVEDDVILLKPQVVEQLKDEIIQAAIKAGFIEIEEEDHE